MKDSKGYLESWSKEIQSSANTIRDLIGEAHWLSDGHHRETVLRDFISRYLPSSVAVDSGFLKPPDGRQKCSKEIDILISDLQSHSPYYCRGGLRIIPPQSLLACIEVKSAWGKVKLKEALNNIVQTQLITTKYCPSNLNWRGICFYGSLKPSTIRNIPKLMETAITETVIPELEASGSTNIDAKTVLLHLPTCIFNLEDFVLFLAPSNNDHKILLRIFNAEDASPAAALIDMFDYVRNRTCRIASDDISNMLDSLDASKYTKVEINVDRRL